MSKQKAITEWLQRCPQLSTLWNISADEAEGANVIIPSGTSYRRNIADKMNVDGSYEADFLPLPSVYEEYQINCYKTFVGNDNEFNRLNFEEVEKVIDWVIVQDELGEFPNIEGKKVVSVECFPFIPQIRGVDPDTGLICYYVSLRITYINPAKRRSIEWLM